MPMTISISQKSLLFILLFIGTSLLQPKQSNAMPASAARVPADSFLILSINLESILQKSKIRESRIWKPILDSWNFSDHQIKNLFLDPKKSGLNSKTPLQLFLRTSNSDANSLSFGVLSMIRDTEAVDQNLASFAESLGFSKMNGKSVRYYKDNFPVEFGRKGRILYILGIGPIVRDKEATKISLNKLFRSITIKTEERKLPSSLKDHFTHSSDLSVYLDGSGLANLVEQNWPDDRWKNLLPVLDPLFTRQFGFHLHSNIGTLRITSQEYSIGKTKKHTVKKLDFLHQLPGDSPLVARLSLPSEEFQNSIVETTDKILRVLSDNKINKDTQLPGFDSTPKELLSAPSGDFVLAAGHFSEKNNYLSNGKFSVTLQPSIMLGFGIEKQVALKKILAGLNSANSLRSILDMNGLHLTDHGEKLWLSSIEYLREVKGNKALQPLSKSRLKTLNEHSFALDLNLNHANQSVRKSSFLNFSQLKILNIIDDFHRLSIHANNTELVTQLKLNDSNRSAWEVVFKHLGQALIDQTNQAIFLAISQNNLNSVIQSVQEGALINATDRFGHSPIHYAAFKGNPKIVDFLLNNGANPNTKGRHDSTPLHSAAWGRNTQVLELLLEDGADVDARTDEGETPGMTAALRGEKDMLEILLALSADPHATDVHGTNLLDLAAAGGHKAIVELLQEIGVNNQNPLHIAAGIGDLKEVKKLLKEGHSINVRDSFGATPLLIAMVSGKEDMVDFLISQNADPNLCAMDGYTLMHGAAFSGKKSLVQKVLTYNTEVNPRYGPDGITPVDVAEETGDALLYLRALGGKTAWELGKVNLKK